MERNKLAKIRMSISRSRGSGGRLRYSKFVRSTICEWLSAGETVASLSEKTGIGLQTLSRWESSSSPKFREVMVAQAEAHPTSVVTLRFTNGVRITTPSVELMIETLESLK